MSENNNDRAGWMVRQPPAEVHEERKAGEALDYRMVIKQSRAVSFAIAAIVLSLLLAIVALGPVLFWTATGIVALTSFIWWMRREAHIERAADDGEDFEGISFVNIATSVAIALLVGFVAWCFWRVAWYLVPALAMPAWWAGSAIQRITVAGLRLFSLLFAVFSLWFFVHLELAFGQEVLQRSPMQEQYLWQALGEILKAWGMARARKPQPRSHPPIIRKGREVGGDGNGSGQQRMEEIRRVMEERLAQEHGELSAEQQEGLELMQFLTLGQHIVGDDGELILYSRRAWNGITLPSGRVMGVSCARKWAGKLQNAGILEEQPTATGSALNVASHLTLADALDRISLAYDVPLPHPDELRAWASPPPQVPAPPHPTHPTQAGEGA